MASRSQLSSDWRAKAQTTTASSNFEQDGIEGHENGGSGTRAFVDSATIWGEDDPRTLQAVEDGRRLYVGNLPYMVKRKDVEDFFACNGYQIEYMNMSIDPYSGRNPSYGFVELTSKSQADSAMQDLNGKTLLGRPVKLGPGVASRKSRKATSQNADKTYLEKPVYDRWTRTDDSTQFKGYSDQGRRVWVGGLPKMENHYAVNTGIRELFAGFQIEAVSKVIIPASPAAGDPKAWGHRYLFVDFPSADEAARAIKATNGKHAWGVKIRTQVAKGADSRKPRERDEWDEECSVLQPS